jgi:ribosome-binding protein aMBF1 (putative translation factor)
MTSKNTTTDAVEILHRRYVANDPEMQELLNQERANHRIAQAILDLRQRLDLSQKQLAKMVGTSASVICRLENADYEGHSLSMLERIAAAVKHRLELDIRFVAAQKRLTGGKNGMTRKKRNRVVA